MKIGVHFHSKINSTMMNNLHILRCRTHELHDIWKQYLREILQHIHVPEKFDEAVTNIDTSLSWTTLHNDWEKMSFQERSHRWTLFCDDITRAAYKTRPYCVRCGQCCKKAPPALHHKDRELFTKGILKRSDTYTLRIGEMVHSHIENNTYPLKEEMIKIKEKPGTRECNFLNNTSCSLYENRPIQCKRFECWSPQKLIDTFKEDRLTRRDILEKTDILAEIIDYHEKKCSYSLLTDGFRELEKEGDEEKVFDILSCDTAIRPFIKEKLSLSPDELDFLFGRPFMVTVKMFGYCIKQNNDNHFVLESLK